MEQVSSLASVAMNYFAMVVAVVIIVCDVVLAGGTRLALLCPLWITISCIRSAVTRPGWFTSGMRCAVPACAMAVSLLNSGVQDRLANRSSQSIARACCRFRSDNGRWPRALDELVPEYCEVLPRAKWRWYGEAGKFLYVPAYDISGPSLFWRNRIGFGHLTKIQCESTE
jgi:hypothetical protein